MSLLIPGTNSIKDTGYEVANSVVFENDGNSDSFSRDMVTATSRRTFTVSMWLKKTKNGTGSEQYLFHSWQDSNNRFISSFDSTNILHIRNRTGGSNTLKFNTNQKFLDTSAWYNIIIAIDTTQSTESNRFKLYVNGTQVTSFSTSDYPSQNADMSLGTSDFDNILGIYGGGGNGFSGYMCEMVYIDGLQLAPTSFGEFDSNSPNIWKPIDVSGLTFGNNGFHLDFENSSSLGADVSGEGHNFTVNNLTSTDQSTDTCTNNFCTLMSNTPSAANFTLSQGNLIVSKSGATTVGLYGSSIMLTNGKWYYESKITDLGSGDRSRMGVAAYESVTGTSSIQGSYSGFEFTGTTSGRFSITVAGSTTEIDGFNTYAQGDIIMWAIDMDNTKLYIGKNGDWFNYSSANTGGDPTSGNGWVTNNATALAAPLTVGYVGHAAGISDSTEVKINFGAPPTGFTISSGNSDGNGYGNFEYAVPSGYYSINSKNLAEYG